MNRINFTLAAAALALGAFGLREARAEDLASDPLVTGSVNAGVAVGPAGGVYAGPPAPGYVWIEGYWTTDAYGNDMWIEGRWAPPPLHRHQVSLGLPPTPHRVVGASGWWNGGHGGHHQVWRPVHDVHGGTFAVARQAPGPHGARSFGRSHAAPGHGPANLGVRGRAGRDGHRW